MERRDPFLLYQRMGVSPDADQESINCAYRTAALKHHPDKAPKGMQGEFTKRFQSLNAAYSVLRDPQKRAEYDRRAKAGIHQKRRPEKYHQQEVPGQEGGFQEFWYDFFSGVLVGCAGLGTIALVAMGAPSWGLRVEDVIWESMNKWCQKSRWGFGGMGRVLGVALSPVAGPLLLVAYAGKGTLYVTDRAVGALRLHLQPEVLCSSSHEAGRSSNSWNYWCYTCSVWVCSACANDCHKAHMVGFAARKKRQCGCHSGCRRRLVLKERTRQIENEGEEASEWTEVTVHDPTRPCMEEVEDDFMLVDGPLCD